jgi:Spherulation-specific family 4
MSARSFLIFVFFLVVALMAQYAQAATQIIVPFYAYPTEQEWSIMEASLVQFPGIEFLLIINPSNGPETSNPNSDWVTGITTLRQHGNVKIIGYVNTDMTGVSTSEVENEVSTYAAWPSNIRPDGIFFDMVAENDVSYYQTISAFVKSTIANGIVVLNPGTLASSEYFGFVDQVMIYESSYSEYHGPPNPGAGAFGGSSIIIYAVPDDSSTFSSLVSTFVSGGYGSLYLTSDPATYQTLGNTWATFCQLMHSHVGGGSSPPPTDPAPAIATTPQDVAPASTSSPADTPAPPNDPPESPPPEDDSTDPVDTTSAPSDPTPVVVDDVVEEGTSVSDSESTGEAWHHGSKCWGGHCHNHHRGRHRSGRREKL